MADSVAEPDLPDAPEDVERDDDLDAPRVLPQMIDDVEAPDVPPDLELLHDDFRDGPRDNQIAAPPDEQAAAPRNEQAAGPRNEQAAGPRDVQVAGWRDERVERPREQPARPRGEQAAGLYDEQVAESRDEQVAAGRDRQFAAARDGQAAAVRGEQGAGPGDGQVVDPRDERGERPGGEQSAGARDEQVEGAYDEQGAGSRDERGDRGYGGEPWWMSAPDVKVAEGPVPGPPATLMDGGHASGPLPILPVQAPPPLPEHRVPDALTSGGWQVVPDGPVDGPAPPLPAPYEAKRRSRGGLLIGTALSAGICLLALIAAGVLYSRLDGDSASPPKLTRAIAIVPTAGGLTKSPEPAAATAAYPFVQAGVRAAGAELPRNVAAVYAGSPMAPQNVVFYGGTGDLGDPDAFLRKSRPSTAIATVKANPGRGGGQGVCGTFAVLADVHVYCAWATRTSFGVIADNAPTSAPDTAAMATLMAKMRADLEKKAS
ncbi:hypothetical protein SMC26_27240 [Actinomadura fulvescens]|uniref:Uncharacterized protein n=1 Tax=Actinomadura fulvescens TaxID=46160 RepID=A0ABN3PVL9_9ACTN